jgi:hypothetical protein
MFGIASVSAVPAQGGPPEQVGSVPEIVSVLAPVPFVRADVLHAMTREFPAPTILTPFPEITTPVQCLVTVAPQGTEPVASHVPAGTITVHPFEAEFTAACMSPRLQDAAIIVSCARTCVAQNDTVTARANRIPNDHFIYISVTFGIACGLAVAATPSQTKRVMNTRFLANPAFSSGTPKT